MVQRFILCSGNTFPFRIYKTLIRRLDFLVFPVCLISTDNPVPSSPIVHNYCLIKIGMCHAFLIGNKRDKPQTDLFIAFVVHFLVIVKVLDFQ